MSSARGRLPRRASEYGRNIGFQERPPPMTVKLHDFPNYGSGNRKSELGE
jgi:hypothetical protein